MAVPNARAAVLVVEDEALILLDIVHELNERGLTVFQAHNARTAIEILKQHPEVSVLFTDIDMPGDMNGLRLGEFVRNRWPPVRIIVTSGKRSFTTEPLPFEGRFIPKPYDTTQVTAEIAALLHA